MGREQLRCKRKIWKGWFLIERKLEINIKMSNKTPKPFMEPGGRTILKQEKKKLCRHLLYVVWFQPGPPLYLSKARPILRLPRAKATPDSHISSPGDGGHLFLCLSCLPLQSTLNPLSPTVLLSTQSFHTHSLIWILPLPSEVDLVACAGPASSVTLPISFAVKKAFVEIAVSQQVVVTEAGLAPGFLIPDPLGFSSSPLTNTQCSL